MLSFMKLGIKEELSRVCRANKFDIPTKIQAKVIPYALIGRDVIGYAQTGSGKTLAYILPIIQNLILKKKKECSTIIVPSRELAFQIASHIEAIGNVFGVKIAVLVGGLENFTQKILIEMNPHILVCTPGRLVDHLGNFSKFKFKKTAVLVLDEADRLLHLDFKKEFSIIFSQLGKKRQSLFFSATVTSNTENLKKIQMRNPVRIQVNKKYKAVKTLHQNLLFIPHKIKECYFAYVCNEFSGSLIICFVDTQKCAEKMNIFLKHLGFFSGCLHGGLIQSKRLEILQKFRFGEIKILVATDLASRGLDIPNVDLVINFDLPNFAREYIHRVGRTARAGKSGRVINFVTQYEVNLCQKIETLLGQKFTPLNLKTEHVLKIEEEVKQIKSRINFSYNNFSK